MTVLPNSPQARDVETMIHSYTDLKAHQSVGPKIIGRGDGVYVYDDDGKRYIEGLAALWSTSLGFSEQRLIDAAIKQMQELPYYHTFAHKSHNPAIDLAEKLLSIAPGKMSKALFQCSGSEANDTAVKLVWYYHNAIGKPAKKKIISRIKGYHGVTVAAASLTGLPHLHMDFDLPIQNVIHADCPHHYRFAYEGESEEDFASRLAGMLERQIIDEGPDTVAAFIAEPVMGAGGVIVPPKTYFEKIQRVLKKYDILFIADEVICGFGRTGNMWGSITFDLDPDIVTCAKALSSSYMPISGIMVNDKVFEAMVSESEKIGVFGHGYTYSGHPVAAAVALETLKIYEERDIVGHVRKMAEPFQARLKALGDHPLVGETRGIGLIGATELVKDKKTKQAFDPKAKVGAHVARFCEQHGVILRPLGDGIGICPPLVLNEEQVHEIFDKFSAALDDGYTWAKDEGLV
ncbi:MAG: aspartate aminotransferase family protein [Alphaproteobacteria bacterium]|nr:aspartate aminotransferase family protein [Alphaproteobacteria bacterium]